MPNGGRKRGKDGSRRVLVTTAVALSALAPGAAPLSAAAGAPPGGASAAAARDSRPRGLAARTLNVTDTAHLRYRGTSGATLIEEGPASGGLAGTVKVRFDVGVSVAASFTISTPRGAVIGHGSGLLHSSGKYASFGGSMTVTRGTGRYTYAHGHGGFYGVINRQSYDLTVQTTGTLSY
ncbi:MAG TPA: autotransporter [Solirubrobacteraceae bacterium]|jgi:hypothetical protein